MLIKRCLTYGVKIYPYQLDQVLSQYQEKKVPHEILSIFNEDQIKKYVKALYLCGEEMSIDWGKGHELMKELGFETIERRNGHRVIMSLVFNPSFEPTA